MAGRSPVYAPNGVAATSQPLATTAALEVLQHGGNAIDAAVTAAGGARVVEPMMTGIGGDMFAIIWSAKDKKLVALNASGRAGSLMTREELVKRGRTRIRCAGSRAVTVPGALAGWDALLKKYGTITLAQGAAAGDRLRREWLRRHAGDRGRLGGAARRLQRDPRARRRRSCRTAQPPKAGDWFRNPDYARTRCAHHRARTARRRSTAARSGRRSSRASKELGGFLTLDDLKKNEPTWVTPISTMFKGYRVWELPPNNQGIATLEMLRILDPYDLKSMGQNSRAVSAPSDRSEEARLRRSRAVRRRRRSSHDSSRARCCPIRSSTSGGATSIRSTRRRTHVEPGPERTSSETIYLTVADKDGNMVSFINSLFDEFGSGVVVPGTGFALHDRGSGFTIEPRSAEHRRAGQASVPHAHSRIRHEAGSDIAPDGTGDEPYMSFGLMGGAMQAQGHAQFLINISCSAWTFRRRWTPDASAT